MSTIIVEHSTWCRPSWIEKLEIPGYKLFGRWQITKSTTVARRRTADIVRLYPRSLGFNSATTGYRRLIDVAFDLGYQSCPIPAIDEIVEGGKSRRKGYIIAPVVGGGVQTLLVWSGGRIQRVDCPYPDTYQGLGNTWSIIVAKP